MGRRIKNSFFHKGRWRMFVGTLMSYSESEGFFVEYPDGDSEHLDFFKVKSLLIPP